MILIHKPIMNGGNRYLGLADYRVMREPATVTVECDYTTKGGYKIYPKPLKISKALVLNCSTMILKPSGTMLYLVPVNLFETYVTKNELTTGWENKPEGSITVKQEDKPIQGELL